jgi:Family of unknown function (DUF6428)
MKLSEIKEILKNKTQIGFQLPNGTLVAPHFHVTEVGKVQKHFVDCGGVFREETICNFQLWEANDYDHRLHPEKLVHIITLAQEKLQITDHTEIEVEYQMPDTIGKFLLGFDGTNFLLSTKLTACLAQDACGITDKPKVKIGEWNTKENTCTPGGGCC